MSTAEGMESSASCYAEPYTEQDVERVLGVLQEYREDGASIITIAKSVKLNENVCSQIVSDLVLKHQARHVHKGGAVLIFPPLGSYDKSIEQVVSEEQDAPKPVKPIETPTRHKCLVTWCECMVPKKGQEMRDHLVRTHNIAPAVAEHAAQLLREGRRIDLDAPRFLCQYCGDDRGSKASKLKHEEYCHKNPNRQKNIDAMRKRQYGDNAILGELTAEKFVQRDKRGVTCPICEKIVTGQGSYQRCLKHIRKEHEKTAKEAKDILKLGSVPCTGGQCVIGERVAEHIKAGPDQIIVQTANPDNYNMSAVLGSVLGKPKPVDQEHKGDKLLDIMQHAQEEVGKLGYRLFWLVEPVG